MLSILIPNYDENVVELVNDLHSQASKLETEFEILISDQAEQSSHFEANNQLNELSNTRYFQWRERIGRSANRNHLADEAKGIWLFFIDDDAKLIQEDTLDRFWKAKHSECVIGASVTYSSEKPAPPFRLRWKYGRSREMRTPMARSRTPYQSFLSFAFLIGKENFNKVRFDESITEYGHEDTLFGKQIKYAFIRPMYIDAPIEHLGIEPSDVFLKKTTKAVENLAALCEKGLVDEDFKLYQTQQSIAKYRLDYLLAIYFKVFGRFMQKNLTGSNPSLFLFDLWKLSYFCTLRRGVKITSKTLRS